MNVAHLVFGVAFVGLALTWLLRATDAVTHDDLGWLLPLTPIVAGVVGLGAAAVTRRPARSLREPVSQPVSEPVSDAGPTARPDREEQP